MTTTKMGAAIVYVPDVAAAIAFWERAFGLERGMTTESGLYAELKGPVPIGFVSETFAHEAARNRRESPPAGIEIALVTPEVDAAYARALEAGCTAVAPPRDQPWGQRVSCVRDVHGVLVSIGTPWS